MLGIDAGSLTVKNFAVQSVALYEVLHPRFTRLERRKLLLKVYRICGRIEQVCLGGTAERLYDGTRNEDLGLPRLLG